VASHRKEYPSCRPVIFQTNPERLAFRPDKPDFLNPRQTANGTSIRRRSTVTSPVDLNARRVILNPLSVRSEHHYRRMMAAARQINSRNCVKWLAPIARPNQRAGKPFRNVRKACPLGPQLLPNHDQPM